MAALATALVVFMNEVSYRNTVASVRDMEQAENTRSALSELLQAMLDAETGQRGYLLTGNKAYLEPYDETLKTITRQLDQLRITFSPFQDQLSDFTVMSRHVSRKMAEMDLSIKMRDAGQEDAWRFVLTTDVGKDQMDGIRTQADKLSASSVRNMALGQAQVMRTLQLSRIGIAIMALSGLLAFYMYLLQTRALLNSGTRAQESLQRERDQLDLQVHERTANLTQLATHLQNVREDERGHLARELHDELGALLTAAKLDVARLKSRLGTSQPEALERITHLTSTLNSGIALKRRIVEDLRPSSLSHLGLVPSLEILAREFEERSGVPLITDLEHVELGGSAQLTAYRLVQESLTNIGKYAEATKIIISLHNREGYAVIEVEDNGTGFDTQSIAATSHGISGMRHRVEAAGGRLTVTSAPGQGTTISAVMPKG
ncbi:MAG: CHASE3 domain-containing protein [Polaromonas sp.]|jgi:signal transduction histidine kinase